MSILLWIVFGGIVGWLSSMITNVDEDMGVVSNIIVGILGALIGGWLVALFGGQGITGFNFSSLLVAILGSVVFLAIIRGFRTPVGRGF